MMSAAPAVAGRIALTGSGWHRGGVEGALLAAGYTVIDAADEHNERIPDAVRVDAVVARMESHQP